jgi:hypothetical protein
MSKTMHVQPRYSVDAIQCGPELQYPRSLKKARTSSTEMQGTIAQATRADRSEAPDLRLLPADVAPVRNAVCTAPALGSVQRWIR